MADETGAPGAKNKPDRRGRGFRQAGALIAEQTRAAQARRGFADARLKALWPEIVGPEFAALAHPVKLSPSRGPAGGLLTLGVLGANGPQVQMLAPLIRERLNAALGPGAVGRIQLTQATTGAAPAKPPRERAVPAPETADIAALQAPLSSIGDPELRAALETLARNVISHARNSAAEGT